MSITADHVHYFIKSTKEGYDVCIGCGTYHSIAQLPPDEIYVNKAYWGEDSGRSTLEQQISNMTCTDECGISKVDRVLQFVPDNGNTVLEIAAAPGIMLQKLTEKGYAATGIEPSEKYLDFIRKTAPSARVIHGYFPQVFNHGEHDLFDCIVALDIMEHCDDYDGFFKAVDRLLTDGGTAIIMSPIIYEDELIRKGEFRPDEHAWIFTKKYLEPYLKSIFDEIEFRRWVVSHEIIILKKKSMYYNQGERFDMELCSDYGLKNDK